MHIVSLCVIMWVIPNLLSGLCSGSFAQQPYFGVTLLYLLVILLFDERKAERTRKASCIFFSIAGVLSIAAMVGIAIGMSKFKFHVEDYIQGATDTFVQTYTGISLIFILSVCAVLLVSRFMFPVDSKASIGIVFRPPIDWVCVFLSMIAIYMVSKPAFTFDSSIRLEAQFFLVLLPSILGVIVNKKWYIGLVYAFALIGLAYVFPWSKYDSTALLYSSAGFLVIASLVFEILNARLFAGKGEEPKM